MSDDTAWYEALADQVRETERDRIFGEMDGVAYLYHDGDYFVRVDRVIDIVKDQT